MVLVFFYNINQREKGIYMNKKQIKEHLQWLKKFTDCKEVKSVSSRNRRKVQRKTNKSNKSSTAHV